MEKNLRTKLESELKDLRDKEAKRRQKKKDGQREGDGDGDVVSAGDAAAEVQELKRLYGQAEERVSV